MSLSDHTVVFGGSFNPPHMGHQMACLFLTEGLGAEAVWLVPSYVHPFGKDLAPFEHRVAMCALMARPFGARVNVSSIERDLGGSGRTYDTLVALSRAHPQRRIALAVGSDILDETDRWHRWPDIRAAYPVIVIGRGGHGSSDEYPVQLPAVASTEIRERIRRGLSVEGLVPETVYHYILEHGLYR